MPACAWHGNCQRDRTADQGTARKSDNHKYAMLCYAHLKPAAQRATECNNPSPTHRDKSISRTKTTNHGVQTSAFRSNAKCVYIRQMLLCVMPKGATAVLFEQMTARRPFRVVYAVCCVYKRVAGNMVFGVVVLSTNAQASFEMLFNSSPSLFLLLISCVSPLPCLGFSPVNHPCSQNSSSLSSFFLSLSGRPRILPIE